MSEWRTVSVMNRAVLTNILSPAICPYVSLYCLKLSKSKKSKANCWWCSARRISLVRNYGRSVKGIIELPLVKIIGPIEPVVIAADDAIKDGRALVLGDAQASMKDRRLLLSYELRGVTSAENTLQVDGKSVAVDNDGSFTVPLELRLGVNEIGMIATNPEGYKRVIKLLVKVSDKDERGNRMNGEPGEIVVTSGINKDAALEIRVKDNGLGMSKEVRRKIFEPFFTTKKTGEGAGLGLAVSYGIIHEHKGDIRVMSFVGHGTLFVITLPIAHDDEKELTGT